jgi:hypothetical protein
MLTSIDLLRHIAVLLAEHDDGDARRFRTIIAEYEAGARYGLQIDELIGLTPLPGQSPWYAIEMLALRDSLLLQLQRTFHADEPSERQQAKKIATRIGRYEAGPWIRDRVWKSPPAQYAGKAEALMFAILKAGRAPSSRTVQRALAAGRVCHELPSFDGTPFPASSEHEEPLAQTAPASRPRRIRHSADHW